MVLSAGGLSFSENNGKLIKIMHDSVTWNIKAETRIYQQLHGGCIWKSDICVVHIASIAL